MTRILASLAVAAFLAGPAAVFAQDATAPTAPAAAAPEAVPAAPPVPTIAPAGDLIGTLQAAGNFTILLKALDASNLTAVLKGAGPLTVVAPTDEAFKALPAGQLDSLMKTDNASQLQSLLVFHLINAAVTPDKFKGGKVPIRNVAGADLVFDATGPTTMIDDATLVAEGTASNGDIYAVNKVLTPAAAAAPAAQ